MQRSAACCGGTHLVLDAWLIEVIAADGAGVCANGPRPHRHCIPLLDLKTFSRFGALRLGPCLLLLCSPLLIHLHRPLVVRHLLRQKGGSKSVLRLSERLKQACQFMPDHLCLGFAALGSWFFSGDGGAAAANAYWANEGSNRQNEFGWLGTGGDLAVQPSVAAAHTQGSGLVQTPESCCVCTACPPPPDVSAAQHPAVVSAHPSCCSPLPKQEEGWHHHRNKAELQREQGWSEEGVPAYVETGHHAWHGTPYVWSRVQHITAQAAQPPQMQYEHYDECIVAAAPYYCRPSRTQPQSPQLVRWRSEGFRIWRRIYRLSRKGTISRSA